MSPPDSRSTSIHKKPPPGPSATTTAPPDTSEKSRTAAASPPLHGTAILSEDESCPHARALEMLLSGECIDCHQRLSQLAELAQQQRELERLRTAARQWKEDADRMAGLGEEVNALRSDVASLSHRLVAEVEKRAEVEAERDRIKEELEELTRSLFEQANGMVADEAKRRFAVEETKRTMEQELTRTQSKLKRERAQAMKLRRKLSSIRAPSLTAADIASLDLQAAAAKDAIISEESDSAGESDTETNTDDDDNVQLPHVDFFASVDVDILPDRRFFESFSLYLGRITALAPTKLFSGDAFMQSCYSEFLEPCIRLGKLTPRKIVDAMLLDHLQIAPNPPASTASSNSNIPSSSSLHSSDGVSEPANAITTRLQVSPSKQQFWSSFTSISSSPTVCGGCGRQGSPCGFQLYLSAASSSSQSTRQDFLWIDTWCRDRIYAVWECLRFLQNIQRQLSAAASRSATPSELASDYSNGRTHGRRAATPVPIASVGSRTATPSTPSSSPQRNTVNNNANDRSLLGIPSMSLLNVCGLVYFYARLDEDFVRLQYAIFLRLLKQSFLARIGLLSYFRKAEEFLLQEHPYQQLGQQPEEQEKTALT